MFKGERERTCNHERAVHLFTDSILKPTSCQYVGYKCSSYSDFELAKCMSCEETCGRMGYHAEGTGIYYLKTKAKVPYCADVVKLTATFAKGIKKSYGAMILTLVGESGEKENVTLTEKDEKLVPGGQKVLAITLGEPFKPLREIQALYLRYNGWFTKGAETFGIDSVTMKDTEDKYVYKSCNNDLILKDNEYQTLKETDVTC
ncbi:Lipoprotein lipase, partial [Stegodyphus mimosarum]